MVIRVADTRLKRRLRPFPNSENTKPAAATQNPACIQAKNAFRLLNHPLARRAVAREKQIQPRQATEMDAMPTVNNAFRIPTTSFPSIPGQSVHARTRGNSGSSRTANISNRVISCVVPPGLSTECVRRLHSYQHGMAPQRELCSWGRRVPKSGRAV
jgi:hypothetical protein